MPKTLPTTVEAAQVRESREADPQVRLIDVRTPGEFASSHIPGSYNVPLDLLREHREELTAQHGDPVVVGPEGGISERELEALCAAGARPVRLGAKVMRSSTAGPAALAALSAVLGLWD